MKIYLRFTNKNGNENKESIRNENENLFTNEKRNEK